MNGLDWGCPPLSGVSGVRRELGRRRLPCPVRTLSKPSPPLSDHHNPGRKGMPHPCSGGVVAFSGSVMAWMPSADTVRHRES